METWRKRLATLLIIVLFFAVGWFVGSSIINPTANANEVLEGILPLEAEYQPTISNTITFNDKHIQQSVEIIATPNDSLEIGDVVILTVKLENFSTKPTIIWQRYSEDNGWIDVVEAQSLQLLITVKNYNYLWRAYVK